MVDEETILIRDNQRTENCRMEERCIILLNNFKNYNFEERYILDTTNFTVEGTLKEIESENRFII